MQGTAPERMTEEELIELGANLLGEIVTFTLLSVILLLEYRRSGNKKIEKERIKDEEIITLAQNAEQVADQTQKQTEQLIDISIVLDEIVEKTKIKMKNKIYKIQPWTSPFQSKPLNIDMDEESAEGGGDGEELEELLLNLNVGDRFSPDQEVDMNLSKKPTPIEE